jgi:penicillin-binding protein 1A
MRRVPPPQQPVFDENLVAPNFEPARPPSSRARWIKRGLAASLLALILIIAWLAVTAPLSKSLEPIAPPRLTLLSADGQPIARNGAIIDRPVRVGLLPAHVKQAFIAIEDRRFYSHWGIDPRGIARAAWNNIGSGGTQGASTITQQLAKFTFLTADRTYSRKAREMFIAFWLEAWLTKDEILERYLSNAYFGENLYGLRAASLHYYFRQPERLTLAQAATLAGLVQAPSRLAPTRNPKAAAKRARMVLNAMADQDYISVAKAKATGAAATDVRIRAELPTGTYFADWAMPAARASTDSGYGEQKVTTTLDARLQRIARSVTARAPLGKSQVALVAMRPNGEVVAMLGGKSYKSSTFNRVTQARRQPGSTFKLFVYLAALVSLG